MGQYASIGLFAGVDCGILQNQLLFIRSLYLVKEALQFRVFLNSKNNSIHHQCPLTDELVVGKGASRDKSGRWELDVLSNRNGFRCISIRNLENNVVHFIVSEWKIDGVFALLVL